jgi:hypothetical protein
MKFVRAIGFAIEDDAMDRSDGNAPHGEERNASA